MNKGLAQKNKTRLLAEFCKTHSVVPVVLLSENSVWGAKIFPLDRFGRKLITVSLYWHRNQRQDGLEKKKGVGAGGVFVRRWVGFYPAIFQQITSLQDSFQAFKKQPSLVFVFQAQPRVKTEGY